MRQFFRKYNWPVLSVLVALALFWIVVGKIVSSYMGLKF